MIRACLELSFQLLLGAIIPAIHTRRSPLLLKRFLLSLPLPDGVWWRAGALDWHRRCRYLVAGQAARICGQSCAGEGQSYSKTSWRSTFTSFVQVPCLSVILDCGRSNIISVRFCAHCVVPLQVRGPFALSLIKFSSQIYLGGSSGLATKHRSGGKSLRRRSTEHAFTQSKNRNQRSFY